MTRWTASDSGGDGFGACAPGCSGEMKCAREPDLMSLQDKEYKRVSLVAAGLNIPDAKTCEGCHNERSPLYTPFDFTTRKAQGTHQHFPLQYPHG